MNLIHIEFFHSKQCINLFTSKLTPILIRKILETEIVVFVFVFFETRNLNEIFVNFNIK